MSLSQWEPQLSCISAFIHVKMMYLPVTTKEKLKNDPSKTDAQN